MNRRWARPTASLYVDLENLVGRWWELPEATLSAWTRSLFQRVPPAAFAHVAGAKDLVAAVLDALPTSKQIMLAPRQPNAADALLIERLQHHPSDVREVWILSGDHAFAAPARRLATAGHAVHVASCHIRLSRSLADVANRIHPLSPPTPPTAWTVRAA